MPFHVNLQICVLNCWCLLHGKLAVIFRWGSYRYWVSHIAVLRSFPTRFSFQVHKNVLVYCSFENFGSTNIVFISRFFAENSYFFIHLLLGCLQYFGNKLRICFDSHAINYLRIWGSLLNMLLFTLYNIFQEGSSRERSVWVLSQMFKLITNNSQYYVDWNVFFLTLISTSNRLNVPCSK